LVQNHRHKPLLLFVRRIVDVPLGYSKDDLIAFRDLARRDYAALTSLIDEYILMADRASTNVLLPSKNVSSRSQAPGEMHLFDLLRDKRLFPSNAELSDFAGRIFPKMVRRRFDKMSRGDIAARIIEYLETRNPRTRQTLETSMREAITAGSVKTSDRKSFFSKWERIIKGTEL
jgi:hypothetical protein